MLTGTNLNLYGLDFHRCIGAGKVYDTSPSSLSGISVPESAWDLADVMIALDRIDGVQRLRLGSLESGLITEAFIEKIRDVESLCPSFHLSLQSGCDRVLKAMRRRDTRDSYREAVALIRSAFPGAGITTDLIAGFPGETQDDFEETLAFCDEIGFYVFTSFVFLPLRDTCRQDASSSSALIAAERSEILRMKAAELAEIAIRERMGQTRAVLIEKYDAYGRAEGYTPEYVFVKGYRLPDACGEEMPARGSIVPMKITGIEGQTAIAEIV